MDEEFTFLGFTMPKLATYEGAFLVVWGIGAYFVSGQESITAMIPTFMGAPLMLLGVLSERLPHMRHHLMHAAMVVALAMVVGGARIFGILGEASDLLIASHIVLVIVGATVMVGGILSFRAARLAREGAE